MSSEAEIDVDWSNLDLPKFYTRTSLGLMAVRGVAFPFFLVKTRLQAAEANRYASTSDAFRQIWRKDGIRGFYRGFITSAAGVLPAQATYITTYEIMKSTIRYNWQSDDPNKSIALRLFATNFLAGGVASIASACVSVPVDVISQRLMMQDSKGGSSKYSGGLDALFKIIKQDGVTGLWRGLGVSTVVYPATSATWWGSFGFIKGHLFPYFSGNDFTEVLCSSICGGLAAAFAGLLTNPLDMAKTRIQTQLRDGSSKPLTVSAAIKQVYKQEGLLRLWTKGYPARLLAMCPMSMGMVSAYEYMKKSSRINVD